jgi:hypothetical protein
VEISLLDLIVSSHLHGCAVLRKVDDRQLEDHRIVGKLMLQ